MLRKTLVAAVALGAMAVGALPAIGQPQPSPQNPTMAQNSYITVLPQPEQGYAVTYYDALPVSEQPAFNTWFGSFQPDQRILVVRALHGYYTTPNVTVFTTDTTPEMALPVYVSGLPATDQDSFTTFWNGMTPDQRVAFVRYTREITVPSATVETHPDMDDVQDPNITQLPQPEQGYAMSIYKALPSADQSGFTTWFGGLPSDQRVLAIRAMHSYYTTPNVTVFTTDTTPEMALPVFVGVLPSSDQSSFTTFWNGLTPDQQNAFIMYSREASPGMMTNQTMTTPSETTSSSQTTTTTTTEMNAGGAAQPFGTTIAAAFVATLPESAHTPYMNLASTTPISELGGMNQFLSTLTPEQAGMCVQALASINAMGMSGAHPQKGMSDYNVKNLLLGQVADSDKTAFDSMMNGMTDQQKSSLEQLARDAFNGGMNDIGSSATTASTTTP